MIKQTEGSTIPSCSSLMFFFDKDDMDYFFEILYIYVLFCICVETNFVDFEEFCELKTVVRNS